MARRTALGRHISAFEVPSIRGHTTAEGAQTYAGGWEMGTKHTGVGCTTSALVAGLKLTHRVRLRFGNHHVLMTYTDASIIRGIRKRAPRSCCRAANPNSSAVADGL